MQSCSLCGSGPFNKSHFKEHELTQKHLKAFKAQQEEASSSSYVCAVCAGSSFVSKRNYEQHCLSQKHVKALASPSKKQRTLKASEEVENHVNGFSLKNLALKKRLTSPEMQPWMLGYKRRLS